MSGLFYHLLSCQFVGSYLKVKPVIGALPDKFRIVKNIIGDPLKDLPTLPTNPPKFKPMRCYTEERKDKCDKAHPGFLWPPERHLLHYFMMIHNDTFMWEISEKTSFLQLTYQLYLTSLGYNIIFRSPQAYMKNSAK